MVPGIRVGGIKQSCVSVVCLSVAYVVSNSRTQMPWKTKIGTEVIHVTCASGNSFEVKRSPHSFIEFIHSFFHSYRNRFTWLLVLSELQGHVAMSKKVKRKKVVSKAM